MNEGENMEIYHPRVILGKESEQHKMRKQTDDIIPHALLHISSQHRPQIFNLQLIEEKKRRSFS
jgi:hypothetical protein